MTIQHKKYVISFTDVGTCKNTSLTTGLLWINGVQHSEERLGTDVCFYDDFLMLPLYSRSGKAAGKVKAEVIIIYLPLRLQMDFYVDEVFVKLIDVREGNIRYYNSPEGGEILEEPLPPALFYKPSQDPAHSWLHPESIDQKYITLMFMVIDYLGEYEATLSMVMTEEIASSGFFQEFMNDFFEQLKVSAEGFTIEKYGYNPHESGGCLLAPFSLIGKLLQGKPKPAAYTGPLLSFSVLHLLHVADRGHWFEAEAVSS